MWNSKIWALQKRLDISASVTRKALHKTYEMQSAKSRHLLVLSISVQVFNITFKIESIDRNNSLQKFAGIHNSHA